MARAAVVVLDACGVGALPDADAYGDAGTHTLRHLGEAVGGLDLPILEALGLGCVDAIPGVEPTPAPWAVHGRLAPSGPGKDSTCGHWELMGAVTAQPLPTYPGGFDDALVARLSAAVGHSFCCARPSNGITVLEEFGAWHLATGDLILYTSQDSVLQIAAHVDVLDDAGLYEVCAQVRALMVGADAVGRVIARPFRGSIGAFERTAGRKDLAVDPPGPTYLDTLTASGVPVHAVGKVSDLFAGRGITEKHAGATNAVALERTSALLRDLDEGFVFTNLVETDQVYGHRKDVDGFHRALQEIDRAVRGWLDLLRKDDLLILTADHGCDPAAPHTDHTREHVPLLALGSGIAGRRHDGAFADVGATVHAWLTGGTADGLPGTPVVSQDRMPQMGRCPS